MTSTTRARMPWMDLMRGVAIVLVLLWHAATVPAGDGYTMPGWLLAANDSLQPFRMPALMFLSGLLLQRSLSKPLPTFVVGKLRLLVWPYVVWVLVLKLVGDGRGSDTPAWHPQAWIAVGYLWFIFFIACYYAVAPLLQRLPAWLVPVAAFAVSIPVDGQLTEPFLYFAGFFFTGDLVARYPDALQAALSRRWLVLACAGLAVALAVVATVRDVEHQAHWAPLSLAGILAAIALAQVVDRRVGTRTLQGVGRHSIVYYASHYPVMMVVAALCAAAGVPSFGLVAVLCLVVAGAVGAALVRWRDVPALGWLFVAPRRTRGAVAGA